MTDLCSLTLKEAIEVAKKDGAQPILDAFSKRAAALNPKINAFLRFDPSQVKKSETRFYHLRYHGALGVRDG